MRNNTQIREALALRDRARERNEALAQLFRERAEQRRHEQVYNIGTWIMRYEAARAAMIG